MTDTNDMVYVTENEFEKLVGEDTGCVCESEQRMIRKHSPQAHCPRMQNSFMAKTAQTGVSVYNFNLLSNDDIPKNWEEGENCRESRGAVNDEEGNVVNFEAICQVSHTSPALVRVGYYYYFMTPVNKLRRELVNVTFNSSWLGKEVVADHGNIVRHR